MIILKQVASDDKNYKNTSGIIFAYNPVEIIVQFLKCSIGRR